MICQNDKDKMDMAMLLFNSKQAVGISIGYAKVIALFKDHCDQIKIIIMKILGRRRLVHLYWKWQRTEQAARHSSQA